MQKKWLQKASKETFRAILTSILKKNWPKKLVRQGNRKGWRVLKKLAKLKEYTFTPQWVRIRLHLLNVHFDTWKVYFTVTWKILETSTLTNCLSSSHPWIPKKFFDRLDTTSCQEVRFSVLSVQKTTARIKKAKFKIWDRFRISEYDCAFRKCYEPQFTREAFEIVATFSKKPPTYAKKKDEQDEILRRKIYQKGFIKII